jgi:hypothetical protein
LQLKLEEDKMEVDQIAPTDIITLPSQEDFDYQASKLATRALYDLWRQDEDASETSIALLSRFKAETGAASASLCEQLRIVLEP